ncbi:MAG TPA: hypothetical protein VJ499_03540 [Flavisolibacter sp.]|nr:hypothetical protein [Flavisolibacter sp.]
MIRSIIILILCLGSYTAFCQDETAMLTAEKSSDWIKVEMPATSVRVRTSAPARRRATRSRTQSSERQPASPSATKDDFDKTNNKIKRFKKG